MSEKKRAPKTDNPFKFLTDLGIMHIMQTAKRDGQTVEQVITRVQSWTVNDDLNPDWINHNFAPDSGTYFGNPHGKTPEQLTACFQNRVSDTRDKIEQAAVRKVARHSKSLSENGELPWTLEQQAIAVESTVNNQCPKLGHSGERRSTTERISKLENSIDIDLSGLSVLFVKARH